MKYLDTSKDALLRQSQSFSKFWKFPVPPKSMLNLVKFCCQKSKTLRATGKRNFEGRGKTKNDFLFCLNSFVQNCRSLQNF